MNLPLRRLYLLLILAFSTVACGGDEKATVLPTQVISAQQNEPGPSKPTELEPAETPDPQITSTRTTATTTRPQSTAVPPASPSPTASAAPDLSLADMPYMHPSGAFSLVPPAGWSVEESSGSASFNAPDGTGFIYVQMTNTGHELEGQAFDKFVTHRDLNFFDDFAGYEIAAKELDAANGAATVTKFLTYEGIDQTVTTFYYQYGQIIYSFDFWAVQELFDAYDVLYGDVLDTADVDPEAALVQAEYLWVYTSTGPDDLFSIEVPTAWQYERSESDNVVVDTFVAPDEHAVIQNIVYDDGSTISRSHAGDLALQLLHSSYAPDIRVLDDRMQPDGSERLTWTSSSGGFSGISFFETRGTTFLLLTTMYDNAYKDVYIDTLEYTISSYVVPTD